MIFSLRFTSEAKRQLGEIQKDPHRSALCKQVFKALAYLESNPRHPGLRTHLYQSIKGIHGEKVFESYVQNHTPGAYRIFWQYGFDINSKSQKISAIIVIAITPHP